MTWDSEQKLTVVIPTYNRPLYLAESLGSVASQTLDSFRLVVLDNASTQDNSAALATAGTRPVDYVRNPENIGGGPNLIKAMKEFSETEYVTVFHDDDIMHRDTLELQLTVLEADPAIQFVATEYAPFNDGDDPPRSVWEGLKPITEIYDDVSGLTRALLGGVLLCFGSTMYRSSTLRQVEFDVERFSMYSDRPFLLDAARLGKCALIRGPLVLYRIHPGQDTNTGDLSSQNLIELVKSYREALPTAWDEADQDLFYRYSRDFLVESYPRLAGNRRAGAIAFVRQCRAAGVLRWRDLRPSEYAHLAKADGWERQVNAAVALKKWLFRR